MLQHWLDQVTLQDWLIGYLRVTMEVGVTAVRTQSIAMNIQGARMPSWVQLSSHRPGLAVPLPAIQLQLWYVAYKTVQ